MKLFHKIINKKSKEDKEFYRNLKALLNFKPIELSYYKRAFTHRSSRETDSNGNLINYERLEFLGDAMLGSVIASFLYREAPNKDEGYLTKMRAKIVSRKNLNKIGKDLNLINLIKGNFSTENISNNIYGNIFEALIGAIYLDRGYNYCHKFIYENVIISCTDLEKLEGKITSYKSLIIEWCQKQKKEYLFETYEDTGNESKKHFSVKITIDSKLIAKGRDTSKKRAEEMASKRVYYSLQNKIENN